MAAADPSRRLPRKPTVRRFLVLFLVLGLGGGALADDAGPGRALSEEEVVEAALARAPIKEVIEGEVLAEEGRARTASAYPNPELIYSRQHTFNGGSAEDSVSVAQSFDLAGRLRRRRHAGAIRAKAVRRNGDLIRLEIAAEARERFYALLHRQLRVAALEEWQKHVDEALDIVAKREKSGDVAAYDRRRLERERAVAIGRLASEHAARAGAAARLQAVLGGTGPLTVTGPLLPVAEPAPLDTLRTTSRRRPDLVAFALQAEASGLEGRAAARGWIPELRLEAGWKGVSLPGGDRNDGYLFGISFTLPFWDRLSGRVREAEGEARAARGRRAVLVSELDGELGGARVEAVAMAKAATEFRDQAGAISTDLVRMAAAGYAGGELTLLELLDAYRGAVDDETTALDMEFDARRSRIKLDRLTGAALP